MKIILSAPNPKARWGGIALIIGRYVADFTFGPPVCLKAKRFRHTNGAKDSAGFSIMAGLVGLEVLRLRGVDPAFLVGYANARNANPGLTLDDYDSAEQERQADVVSRLTPHPTLRIRLSDALERLALQVRPAGKSSVGKGGDAVDEWTRATIYYVPNASIEGNNTSQLAARALASAALWAADHAEMRTWKAKHNRYRCTVAVVLRLRPCNDQGRPTIGADLGISGPEQETRDA